MGLWTILLLTLLRPHRQLIYHIPSGTFKEVKNRTVGIGHQGQLTFESIMLWEERKYFFQVVFHPFDPSKRSILLKLDMNEVRHTSFNKDKTLAFVGTIWGDLFIIDVQTGSINKYFIGQKFKNLKISNLGNVFLVESSGTNGPVYMAHKIRQVCVNPTPLNINDIVKRSSEFNSLENLEDKSFLSFLTGALQNPEFVNNHPDIIQSFLWKIFLRYPALYVNLHSFYPIIKSLPPFPESLIDKEEIVPQVKNSLRSLLNTQTQFRYTNLSHWNFMSMLQSFLPLLEESEKDFYIEKITISLSNGATENIIFLKMCFNQRFFISYMVMLNLGLEKIIFRFLTSLSFEENMVLKPLSYLQNPLKIIPL